MATKEKKEVLDSLRRIGQQMSNICYNLATNHPVITDHDKQLFARLVREWDATDRHYSALEKR